MTTDNGADGALADFLDATDDAQSIAGAGFFEDDGREGTGGASFDGESLLAGLNDAQRQAVLHNEGPIRVAAIAGAGKTKALIHRIAYLIKVREVPEENIAAVTFSKKAAEEMGTRLREFGIYRSRVGTWHSLALQIIREARPNFLQSWDLDTSNRFKILVKADVLGYRAMNWKKADLGEVLSYIGICKANLAKPDSERSIEIARQRWRQNPCAQRDPQRLHEAYGLAQEALNHRRIVTFDDLLVLAWEILQDEDAREDWASRWSYLIQDEAQDMNYAQATIGEMLARDHRNYMIVGDPGQSIYGFRGSHPATFMGFADEWDAETVSMVQNYRSGASIIEAANGAISHMSSDTHLGDQMVCARGTESRVSVSSHTGPDDEADSIVERMQMLHDDGMSYGDMAALYRINAQSRALEESLLTARVPFVVVGGTNFYERKEVKALLCYLKIAACRADFDDVRKAINSPYRYLGRAFVEGLEAFAPPGRDVKWDEVASRYADSRKGKGIQGRQVQSVQKWAAIIARARESIAISNEHVALGTSGSMSREGAKAHMPEAILERIKRETDYLEWVARDEGSESVENNRASNVQELIRSASRFRTVGEFLDYVEDNLEASKNARAGGKNEDRVTLMTIHRSKGLEWPCVHVLGVNEKIFPHRKAEDIQEERRLWYVAVTRSRDVLHVSSLESAPVQGRNVPMEPSRFIKESGL